MDLVVGDVDDEVDVGAAAEETCAREEEEERASGERLRWAERHDRGGSSAPAIGVP